MDFPQPPVPRVWPSPGPRAHTRKSAHKLSGGDLVLHMRDSDEGQEEPKDMRDKLKMVHARLENVGSGTSPKFKAIQELVEAWQMLFTSVTSDQQKSLPKYSPAITSVTEMLVSSVADKIMKKFHSSTEGESGESPKGIYAWCTWLSDRIKRLELGPITSTDTDTVLMASGPMTGGVGSVKCILKMSVSAETKLQRRPLDKKLPQTHWTLNDTDDIVIYTETSQGKWSPLSPQDVKKLDIDQTVVYTNPLSILACALDTSFLSTLLQEQVQEIDPTSWKTVLMRIFDLETHLTTLTNATTTLTEKNQVQTTYSQWLPAYRQVVTLSPLLNTSDSTEKDVSSTSASQVVQSYITAWHTYVQSLKVDDILDTSEDSTRRDVVRAFVAHRDAGGTDTEEQATKYTKFEKILCCTREAFQAQKMTLNLKANFSNSSGMTAAPFIIDNGSLKKYESGDESTVDSRKLASDLQKHLFPFDVTLYKEYKRWTSGTGYEEPTEQFPAILETLETLAATTNATATVQTWLDQYEARSTRAALLGYCQDVLCTTGSALCRTMTMSIIREMLDYALLESVFPRLMRTHSEPLNEQHVRGLLAHFLSSQFNRDQSPLHYGEEGLQPPVLPEDFSYVFGDQMKFEAREDGQIPELGAEQKGRLYRTYIHSVHQKVYWHQPWDYVEGSLVSEQEGKQKVQLKWLWKHREIFPKAIEGIIEHDAEKPLDLQEYLNKFPENGNGEEARPYLQLPQQDESLNTYFVQTPTDSKTWVEWWTILSRAVDMKTIFHKTAQHRKLDETQLKSEIEQLSHGNVTERISLNDFETYDSAVYERTRNIWSKVLSYNRRIDPTTIPSNALVVR